MRGDASIPRFSRPIVPFPTPAEVMAPMKAMTALKPKVVKAVFNELNAIAQSEVKKNEKFTIPQLVVLKLKHKPARKAGMKVMFGKEVRVAAKPASKVVKAFPAKALKASI